MYNELNELCSQQGITLVVVTKTRSIITIMNFYNEGHRIFGENRVPELVEKYESMPKDINWHMIGHLQSNKVKYISPFVSMIHSGANFSLLKEINKRAKQHNRVIDVLLQIKIGQEEAKSGWSLEELISTLEGNDIQSLENIRIRGVMGMATYTSDESIIRSEFVQLKTAFDQIKIQYYSARPYFDTVSMGMSGDYKIAIEEGTTMIRIGSLLY